MTNSEKEYVEMANFWAVEVMKTVFSGIDAGIEKGVKPYIYIISEWMDCDSIDKPIEEYVEDFIDNYIISEGHEGAGYVDSPEKVAALIAAFERALDMLKRSLPPSKESSGNARG